MVTMQLDRYLLSVETVLHKENVARGGQTESSKMQGGKGVCDVLTFQKSRGQELT